MITLLIAPLLTASTEPLQTRVTIGGGKPLTLADPIELLLAFQNPTAVSIPLHATTRIPVILQFRREKPLSSVSCVQVKLFGTVPTEIPPGGEATLRTRCERFDISALPDRLSPGSWTARVTPYPATTKAPALPMIPIEVPFKIGPNTPPPEKAPTRLRIGKLEISIADQYRGSQRVVGGVANNNGQANVSEREIISLKLRLQAQSQLADLHFVDLWIRPVKANEGAINKAKPAPNAASCMSNTPEIFENWRATGAPRPLWTQAITRSNGQIWEGNVPPGKPTEIWVTAMPNEEIKALREELITFLVRVIDAKQQVHWLESAALNHIKSECSAP